MCPFVAVQRVQAQPRGNVRMGVIADAIQEGAVAFLRAEYTWLAYFVAIATLLLGVVMRVSTARIISI